MVLFMTSAVSPLQLLTLNIDFGASVPIHVSLW